MSTILFLIGLVTASFLNATIYRIDKEYKYPEIFTKRSHCEKCSKQLEWFELIPVLSYLLFRGKCKKCGYPIPIYYPISELLLGIGFASIFYFGLNPYYFVILIFIFIMSYFDRIYHGIPKIIVQIFLLVCLSIPFIMILLKQPFQTAVLVSGFISLTMFLVSKLLRKPFGMGDILILLGLGFVLYPTQYLVFIYMLLIVAFVYVIFRILTKKSTLKSRIPLVPFMFTSFVFTILLGNQLTMILEKLLHI